MLRVLKKHTSVLPQLPLYFLYKKLQMLLQFPPPSLVGGACEYTENLLKRDEREGAEPLGKERSFRIGCHANGLAMGGVRRPREEGLPPERVQRRQRSLHSAFSSATNMATHWDESHHLGAVSISVVKAALLTAGGTEHMVGSPAWESGGAGAELWPFQ